VQSFWGLYVLRPGRLSQQADAELAESLGLRQVRKGSESMNRNGLAYSSLQMLVEDWASEYDDLVKRPDILAKHVADFVFDELLMIPAEEIHSED
jgi:hypothetical protein